MTGWLCCSIWSARLAGILIGLVLVGGGGAAGSGPFSWPVEPFSTLCFGLMFFLCLSLADDDGFELAQPIFHLIFFNFNNNKS
ncbi:hypothetical protein BpHYR1_051222 [Brachionus plicatilis]|uniref:Uncharacterized protein n=1 Tax=Brachionus plicatilis TaxID=10195 RepID=A0A3M7SX65_BRAPC|nr:hypothetical protein BpHYR1_051222 [Brachionus plicatilis]